MDNGTETKTEEQVKQEEKKPVEEIKPAGEIKVEEPEDKIKAEDIKVEGIKVEESEIKKEEVKSEDVKSEEISDELLEKIKAQVEFYFGDINLQRDKFLIEQTKLDEGWIPMTVMLNFKLLASMSKDPEVILNALESSELIEISEDRKKIRRSPEHPLPVFDEAYRKSQAERTVYIKGFPLHDIYIQKLKEFFKPYEPFENIIMRKFLDKEKKLKFKGSIFVQFKTLEGAKAFMARESVKYGDTELIRKYSEDYALEKAKEKEERKLKKGEKKEKETNENDHDSEGGADETNGKFELPKGSLVHFTGTSANTRREAIKKSLMELGGEVAYIDYEMGKSEGWVRLQDANSGKALVEKMNDGKLTINDDVLTFRALEGEEETTYLADVEKTIKQLRNRNKNSKKSRRGRGAQRGRGRKRHGSPAGGATAAKKSANK
ncbi:la protein homolog [Venturia canescens]|uniref:la protein homolog n=1 Tax=Venturia canescens TaxID=32260 RepID=UPI001C9C8A58|nr:la protein homolog [Venturia canescens]